MPPPAHTAQLELGLRDPSDRLVDTTFVVFDTETTGGSPGVDAITELGAVKVRGGQVLGTFHTMVDPGRDIPPTITYLTGISQAMVREAPTIEQVLPTFLAFIGPDAVLVGHNVRFDVGFLHTACDASHHPRPTNPTVDTVSLARRLLREEVPDCRLGTLAAHLRLAHRPSHRALDDAWATVDLLHALLERAGPLGVQHLDDLLELPRLAGHPQAEKLRWVESLPRGPGVYLFRARDGRVIYVGKAVDLRRRVRQYFGGDDRRKIPQLLREAASLDHQACATELEAAVVEARLIATLRPTFNTQGKRASWKAAYVRLDLGEAFPRLAVVRRPGAAPAAVHLGPLGSARAAHQAIEAIWAVAPLRRCTEALGRRPASGRAPRMPPRRDGLCGPAQLGVASCPCAGTDADAAAAYDATVDLVRRALSGEPALLLAPLRERLRQLAAVQRYEDAAALRDRAATLAAALERQARFARLRRAGRVVVEVAGEGGAVLDHGLLVEAWAGDQRPLTLEVAAVDATERAGTQLLFGPPLGDADADAGTGTAAGARTPAAGGRDGPPEPVDPDLVPELAVVARWVHERTGRLVVVGRPAHPLAEPAPLEPVDRFQPRPARKPARAAAGRPTGR